MARWAAPAAGELHLWRAALDPTPDVLARLEASLTEDERARATRFRFPRDRARFAAGRGWLRELLAGYLDLAPEEIRIVAGTYGKPRLGAGPVWLRFNASHSDGLAVFAVARNREVGVDVERIRPDFPIDEVAHHFYSAREQADLAALSEADRLRAAFAVWTRKEAYLKAVGTGLALSLDAFDVTVRPGDPVRLHGHGGGAAQARRWSLHTVDLGPDYAAAVSVEGRPRMVPAKVRELSIDLR
ncbi:MAG: 4'-phosphopantetheinyl transferase superfamily protein [Candidatus Dormibacteraeota bacterium]|nr:4'-phosphopantetheinyl transferase superfamily protein [Candidatus Dormibacteraeota bacterium]